MPPSYDATRLVSPFVRLRLTCRGNQRIAVKTHAFHCGNPLDWHQGTKSGAPYMRACERRGKLATKERRRGSSGPNNPGAKRQIISY
jgi:hypothetical protein